VGQIVVINNPNAKLNRKLIDRFDRLSKVLDGRGQIYQTRVPEEIQPIADKLAREDIEILAVCGGDGTLHHTLTAFIKAYGGTFPPILLPLKGGTTVRAKQSPYRLRFLRIHEPRFYGALEPKLKGIR